MNLKVWGTNSSKNDYIYKLGTIWIESLCNLIRKSVF